MSVSTKILPIEFSSTALMQEYRTRQTANVVTSKLDVRPAVAHLPDITTNSTPEPATEAPSEDEPEEAEA